MSASPPSPSQDSDGPGAELATALHEVSNALTVVLGWLDVAQQRASDGPTREAIELALSYARLGFSVSRLAIGADPPAGEDEHSAAGLARGAVLAVTPQAQRKGVLLRLDTATGVDDHVADSRATSQILLNLLLNAIAFTERGGSVSLALRQVDEMLVFQVRDQGPGISPDRAAKLLDGVDSTREGGAGIGLRHSFSLATACGGRLSLFDPGPGACFELRWPISGARSRARQAFPTQTRLDGAKILVLEDDPAVLGLIELALQARGAEVLTATTLGELQAIAAEPMELAAALLDLSPIATAPRSAFEALNGSGREVPIVLITGSASGVPEAMQHEVRAWVRKPFEMSEVIDVLCTLKPRRGSRPPQRK